ncbi:MAG: hypothetical protein LBM61_04190 [Prevotellaceae bacterium]|nr:hypothetical protein [Prevotellaceae bacterium]
MKITKSVSSTTKPHNLTPEALNLRNPMQVERSDAQLGVVTSPLTTTPVGVEPTSGFSAWGTPILRVSPTVTQIERLRRSTTQLRTPTPQAGVEPTSGFSAWGTPPLRVSPAVTQIERLWRSATSLRTSLAYLRRSATLLRTLVVCLRRSATPAWSSSDISHSYYINCYSSIHV